MVYSTGCGRSAVLTWAVAVVGVVGLRGGGFAEVNGWE